VAPKRTEESGTLLSIALSCVLLLGGFTFAPSETIILPDVFSISSIGRTPVDGGAFWTEIESSNSASKGILAA
jgi:hypothetical protein